MTYMNEFPYTLYSQENTLNIDELFQKGTSTGKIIGTSSGYAQFSRSIVKEIRSQNGMILGILIPKNINDMEPNTSHLIYDFCMYHQAFPVILTCHSFMEWAKQGFSVEYCAFSKDGAPNADSLISIKSSWEIDMSIDVASIQNTLRMLTDFYPRQQ